MSRPLLAGLTTLTLLAAAGCSATAPEKKPTDTPTTPAAATSAAPTPSTETTSRQSSGKIEAATSESDPRNCALLTEAQASELVGSTMKKAPFSGMGVGKVVEGNKVLRSCAMAGPNGQTLSYMIVQSPNAKAQLEKALKENSEKLKTKELSIGEAAYSVKILDSAPTMAFAIQGNYSVSVQSKAATVAAEDKNVSAVLTALVDAVKS